jgi:hypothetical protein
LRKRFTASGTPFRELEHPPAASALDYHRIVGSRLGQQAKALLDRSFVVSPHVLLELERPTILQPGSVPGS